MTFGRSVLTLAAALAAASAFPGAVVAQQRGTQAQRAENARAAADLRARIEATRTRIAEARRSGAITPARAARLNRQVSQTQASMTRLSRQQGLVSAAELASYNRTLAAIDVALDRRGVDSRYGDDMLIPPPNDPAGFAYDCQNVPVRIAIPAGRLDVALNQLRLTTHCPIDGWDLVRGKRSYTVTGLMTPIAALRTMLLYTGLEGKPVKQGLAISRRR